MTYVEALEKLISVATAWGENQEEGFSRRVTARDTDADCEQLAGGDLDELSDILEVRDLWEAAEIVNAEIERRKAIG